MPNTLIALLSGRSKAGGAGPCHDRNPGRRQDYRNELHLDRIQVCWKAVVLLETEPAAIPAAALGIRPVVATGTGTPCTATPAVRSGSPDASPRTIRPRGAMREEGDGSRVGRD